MLAYLHTPLSRNDCQGDKDKSPSTISNATAGHDACGCGRGKVQRQSDCMTRWPFCCRLSSVSTAAVDIACKSSHAAALSLSLRKPPRVAELEHQVASKNINPGMQTLDDAKQERSQVKYSRIVPVDNTIVGCAKRSPNFEAHFWPHA